MWGDFTFLDGFTNDGVERLNGIGGVNDFSDVFWVIEDGTNVLPMITP